MLCCYSSFHYSCFLKFYGSRRVGAAKSSGAAGRSPCHFHLNLLLQLAQRREMDDVRTVFHVWRLRIVSFLVRRLCVQAARMSKSYILTTAPVPPVFVGSAAVAVGCKWQPQKKWARSGCRAVSSRAVSCRAVSCRAVSCRAVSAPGEDYGC